MKILLVSNTDWYLYNHRLALAKFLRSQGYNVVMVSPPGDFVPLLKEDGFRWIGWSVGRQSVHIGKEIEAIIRLARIYKNEQPDVLHHFTIKPVLYGSFAARLVGVRGVVNSLTGRGYVFLSKEHKARVIRPLVHLLYKIAFRTTGCQVIFENPYDQQYFIENHLVRPDKTQVIPGVGIDEQKFTPSAEPKEPPIITYAGRLLWDKGIGVLVDSGRILKNRNLSFRLALVGDPDPGNPSSISPDQIQAWVQNKDIEWWGFQKEMAKVYQQSHIVVLPSFGEGVPTTLMEAAATGRPLVASDIAGCREVIQDGQNGFLVPVQDAVALADALEKLLCDPSLRQRMGTAGRKIALDKFTHTTINRETLNVYHRIYNLNDSHTSFQF